MHAQPMASISTGVRFYEMNHDVYFDDLDAFHILHNARYLLLMERTIGSFWNHIGFGSWDEKKKNPDAFQLVRSNHLEYLQPVEGTQTVRVRVWIEKLGTTSLTFACCIMKAEEDVDCATGTRVLVRIDPNTKRPAPWGESFKGKVEPYMRKSNPPVPSPSPPSKEQA